MGKGSLSINQIVVFRPSSINNYLTLYMESLFVSSIDINKFLANYTFQEAIVLPQQLKNKLGSLPSAPSKLTLSDKQIAEACFRYFGVKNPKRACHRLDPTQSVHHTKQSAIEKQ